MARHGAHGLAACGPITKDIEVIDRSTTMALVVER
jgi:hypothetical protein